VSDRSAAALSATAPAAGAPAVQAGQQFHGRGGHTRAHVRVRALHTAAAVASPLGRRQRVVAVEQPVPRTAAGRRPPDAAAADYAPVVRGRRRPPRVRVRLSLLCASRGGPPDRRPQQVGGHVPDSGVPPRAAAAAAAAAVGWPARFVLAVGRHAPRVAQGPRPVLGRRRVTADDAPAAPTAAVSARVARPPSATAPASGSAAAAAAATTPVRQLRFRDRDHCHRGRFDDQRKVPVAHRPAGRQTGQAPDRQGHRHHTGTAQLENRGRRAVGPRLRGHRLLQLDHQGDHQGRRAPGVRHHIQRKLLRHIRTSGIPAERRGAT